MNLWSLAQYGLFLLIVTLLVKLVGSYLTSVFSGAATPLDRLLAPVERALYRLAGVDPKAEMSWRAYATAFVLFTFAGTLLLYLLLRVQPLGHPADPVFRPAPLAPDLAMNTAVSFATTTTWQAYGGEPLLPGKDAAFGPPQAAAVQPGVGQCSGMRDIEGQDDAVSAILQVPWRCRC